MKTKQMQTTVALVIVAMLLSGVGVYFLLGGGSASTVDTIVDPVTGEEVAPWSNTIVNYKLLVSDAFTGTNVAGASVKVYNEKPADWGNPRGTFSEATEYTVYAVSGDSITVNKEYPGTYYAVMTASGYNTEFIEFTIPNGEGRGDISDYQSNPDSALAEMSLVGATTDLDFAFALVNSTDKTIKGTVLLTVDESTEFKGWKVIVNDEEGFSTDTDGDGVYDEGVNKYTVSVAGIEKIIFEPGRGVDEFDSNDEYTFLLDGITVADENEITIKVEVVADATGDFIGADDETWGEGEGVLSYIKIYDAEGNLFSTTDVTA